MPTLPEARHDDVDRHAGARPQHCAMVLCAAAARAEPADPCAVPGYLLFGDSQLERVAAAVKKDKAAENRGSGRRVIHTAGPGGASFAYPARLEAALSRRLPGVKVTVAVELQAAPDCRGNV